MANKNKTTSSTNNQSTNKQSGNVMDINNISIMHGLEQMSALGQQAYSAIGQAAAAAGKTIMKSVGGAAITLANLAADTMVSVANQDLAFEKMAAHMNISKAAAWEMQSALTTLGESLDDVNKVPELKERYDSLVADGRQMMPTGDYDETMKGFRDLMFESKRLEQEGSYAMQHIGYQLMKSLKEPLKDATDIFKRLNDFIVSNMPGWSEKIGQVFKGISVVLMPLWGVIKRVANTLIDLSVGVIAAFGAIIDWFAASGIYEALLPLSAAIGSIFNVLIDLVEILFNLFAAGLDAVAGSDKLPAIKDMFIAIIEVVTFLINKVAELIAMFKNLFVSIVNGKAWDSFQEKAAGAMKFLTDLLNSVLVKAGKLGQALLELVKLNFSGAYKLTSEALFGTSSQIPGSTVDSNNIGQAGVGGRSVLAQPDYIKTIFDNYVKNSLTYNNSARSSAVTVSFGDIYLGGNNLSKNEARDMLSQGISDSLLSRGAYSLASSSMTGSVQG